MMDGLHSEEASGRTQPSLWVKMKLPAGYFENMQTPAREQLLPGQTEAPAAPQKDPSELEALKTTTIQPEGATVDSPLSHVHQDNSTITADGVPSAHHDTSPPDVAPLMKIASLLVASQDDTTTTAGASFPEPAPEAEQPGSSQPRSDNPINEDSDCIRVSRPRPVGEDAPKPILTAEPQNTHRKRSSISIQDLLRPMSEEPVAQGSLPNPMLPRDADVLPAAQSAYITPDTIVPTLPDDAATLIVLTAPTAEMRPPSDAGMQEPDPEEDTPATATAIAVVPQTPQTGKVTFRLSPAGMAKFSTFANSSQSARDYGRDRNPRRNATRAFGAVKAPERPPPAVKPRKAAAKSAAPVKSIKPVKPTEVVKFPVVVDSIEPPTNSRLRKRGAQSNGQSASAKRQKINGAAPITRSSRGPSEPAEYVSEPAAPAPPTFQLDVATGEPRPIRDVEGDCKYVQRMLSVLKEQSTAKINDTCKEQSITMRALLNRATCAGDDEALFLTTSEAAAHMAPGEFWNNVIITSEQQPLPLQSIDQFLREFYEEDVKVWIQDSGAKSSKEAPAIRQVSVKAVRERFAADKPQHPKPWNLLELATHHDDGFRPHFLSNEDCRLLTKLKIPTAADHTQRNKYPVGFKEVEKWALLAQAGALTLPHQDSHGYSTYITVNVGLVGFGWMSAPTPEKRAEWTKTTQKFIDGPWRYVVLKPGQTVYFPAGTVHFVFRLPSEGNTLAFGGHVLRCSNIVHWVRCLLEEVKSASITNEDLTESATGYLDRVERFVKEARKTGNLERWGGEESVTEFLRLKADFMRRKQRQR